MKPTATSLVAALTLAIALTADIATAQQPTVTIPRNFARVFSNSNIVTPFGRTKYFGQTWYRGDSLPKPFLMTQIGFRTGPNVSYSAMTIKFEFVLDNSKVTFGTLSKTFSANLTQSATTFYKMKNLNVPAVNKNQDPMKPVVWLPGDQVMVFTGPNLIVQNDIQTSTSASSTGWTVEGYSMSTGAPSRIHSVGTSCGKSTLSSAYANNQYTLTVTGAPASTPVTFYVGLDNQRRLGGGPLPVDLGVIGMTNCLLELEPLAAIPVTSNASGSATLSATLNPPTSSFFAFIQAAHAEQSANPANYVATNMESTLFGAAGISTYVYNWTTFGPTAQFGPYNTNRGQVMLIR
jgi:hypothetical protein